MKRFLVLGSILVMTAVANCGLPAADCLLPTAYCGLASAAARAKVVSAIWKSQTTGNEYRVRIDKDHFYAEWVNIPHELAGAYVHTECARVGDSWAGVTSSYLPCPAGQGSGKQTTHWCRLTTRIEITSITRDRITGRAQNRHRFDCQNCRILESVWKDFVWVPKPVGSRQSPVGSRQWTVRDGH